MIHETTRSLLPLAIALIATAIDAQELRHAVRGSDVVVVATDVGVRKVDETHAIHTLRVASVLGGEAPELISVVEVLGVSLHHRPEPGEQKLYCLRNQTDRFPDLPREDGPFFTMSGHAGSNPKVSDPDHDPICGFVRLTLDSERGVDPVDVKQGLVEIALGGASPLRTEALAFLTERPILLGKLDTLEMADLLSRAVGETEDVPYKIALAELCAEKRLDGLVPALCVALDQVDDASFAEALGRIARHLHGEAALDVLRPQLMRKTRAATRKNLILALGATSTERALEALLRMRATAADREAVDAALRMHGAPRALEAIERKQDRDE